MVCLSVVVNEVVTVVCLTVVVSGGCDCGLFNCRFEWRL